MYKMHHTCKPPLWEIIHTQDQRVSKRQKRQIRMFSIYSLNTHIILTRDFYKIQTTLTQHCPWQITQHLLRIQGNSLHSLIPKTCLFSRYFSHISCLTPVTNGWSSKVIPKKFKSNMVSSDILSQRWVHKPWFLWQKLNKQIRK